MFKMGRKKFTNGNRVILLPEAWCGARGLLMGGLLSSGHLPILCSVFLSIFLR